MRRLLNQAAQSAVKVKGSIFELTFSRLLPRLGYQQAIWAIAHRLCRVLWVILHAGVRYEERGPAVSAKSKRTRAARMVRELKKLGYRVEGGTTPCGHSGMNGWGFSNLSSSARNVFQHFRGADHRFVWSGVFRTCQPRQRTAA
jgi:hypothetical protein